MRSKKINIALIGAGQIAQNFHIPAWKKIKNIKITSICDKDFYKAKKVARKKFIPFYYNDVENMLRKNDIDIVDICSSPSSHYKNVLQCLKYKKNILIEKPFVISSKQSKILCDKIKKSKISCMCAQHQRFRPESIVVKKIIDQKLIGNIYFVKITVHQYNKIPSYSKDFSIKSLSGGGPLIDLGSHFIDLVCWFLNFPKPERLSASLFSNIANYKKSLLPFKQFNNEEFSTGTIFFKKKIVCNFDLSYLLNTEKEEIKIELFGEKGKIIWPKCEIYLDTKNGLRRKKILVKSKVKASYAEMSHFLDVMNRRTKQIVDLKQTHEVVRIIEKLYSSAFKGREVKF